VRLPLALLTALTLTPACKKDASATASAAQAVHDSPAPNLSCGTSDRFGPLRPQPVLAGRFVLCVPDGTTLQPNPAPLMGAPEPPDMISVLRLPTRPGGPARATLLFQDTLGLASEGWQDFSADKLQDELDASSTRRDTLGPGVQAVYAGPKTLIPGGRNGTGLVVRHPDHTLHLVGFRLDEGAEPLPRVFVMELLQTLSDGGGARPIGGSRELPTGPRDQVLRIDLPDGFVVTTDRGGDFVVHRFIRLATPDMGWVSGAVYFGGHPHVRASQDAPQVQGRALSQPATFSREVAATGEITLQALLTLTGPLTLDRPAGDDLVLRAPRAGWFAHVMISAPDDESMAPIRTAIEQATWVDPDGDDAE